MRFLWLLLYKNKYFLQLSIKDATSILILGVQVLMEDDISSVKGQDFATPQKKRRPRVRRLMRLSLQVENVFGETLKRVGCAVMEGVSSKAR